MSRSQIMVRNVISTIVTQLLLWAMTFAVVLTVPRYLGDVGMGAFTLASSISLMCALIVSLGTSTVLVREVARDHSRASELLVSAIAMRIVMSIVAFGVAELAAVILHYPREVKLLVGVGVAAMAMAMLVDVLTSVLTGLEQIPRQNVAMLVEKAASTGLILVLIYFRQPWWILMSVGIFSMTASSVVAIAALRPHVHALTMPHMASIVSLIRQGAPFMTTAVFVAIYGQSDAIVLSAVVHNPHDAQRMIGWYGLARRLNGTLLFIPVAMTTALLPTLSRVSREDPDAFLPMIKRLMNIMLIAVMPFAAVMIFAPKQVLRFLHYPASFEPSVPVLIVLGGGAIVWYLSQVAGTALIASDLQGALSRITGIAALVSVPLCIGLSTLTLHTLHNGATGAAISDVLVETYLLVAYLKTLPQSPLGWANLLTLGRAAAAAVPMVVALFLTSKGSLLLGAAAGTALYLPLCWLLKGIDPQDIAILRQALTRRSAPEPAGGPAVAK